MDLQARLRRHGMNWPNSVDYIQAIQNPCACFPDDKLKSVKIALTNSMPISISGARAVVVKVEKEDDTPLAIRCFLDGSDGCEDRYVRLQSYFRELKPLYFAKFDYKDKGICVGGIVYPVLVMDWVEGLNINQYVESILGSGIDSAPQLEKLAHQFREMMLDLSSAGIKHSDLQHGNIVVEPNGNLKLVDYDAMYIPGMRALPDENGHPSFRHPKLAEDDRMGENSDHFASIVIYLSLLAISADSSLWNKYYTGENLIFTSADLKQPGQTRIWRDLKESSDGKVVRLSEVLKELCCSTPDDVPSLEQVLSDDEVHPIQHQRPLQTETVKTDTHPMPKDNIQAANSFLNDPSRLSLFLIGVTALIGLIVLIIVTLVFKGIR